MALLKIHFPNPADRLNQTHGLLMTVSHDDAILDPILAFQVESIRSVTFQEGIEISAGNDESSRQYLLGGLPLRDIPQDPFRVRSFVLLVSSKNPSTGTVVRRSNVVIREITFTNVNLSTNLAPDWEEVARHNSSDCYEAGISALSIDSPNESPLKSYRTHALIVTIRAAPSFSFDKPSYRILDAVVKPHSEATSIIVNGIDGRDQFMPDKYTRSVPLNQAAEVASDPRWKAALMKAVNGGDGSSGFKLPPSLPSRPPPCGGCPSNVDTTKLKRCSRCKKQTYCTESCQKRDWQRHKLECVPA
ncbi:hypothetical protein RQP46_001969 [Phenoliferia psychrophenolica]